MKLGCIVFSFFVALASIPASAQTIKKAPVTATSPVSGEEMFDQYCAVCHGKDGKGAGPAASALKKAPANLTTLTSRSGGKFPELKVANVIHGDPDTAAHGSRDMPIWGTLFSSLNTNSPGTVQLRISNLTTYIKSIQQ
jgi:mono/diheme cytochrome c family protein